MAVGQTSSAAVPHPSGEFLERYALGRVEEKDCSEFEEHLLICHLCQDRLAEADQYVRITQEAARIVRCDVPGPSFAKRFWPVWVAACAAFSMALIIPSRANFPAQELEPRVTRGPEATIPEASRGRRLVLKLDVTEIESLPRYSIEVVDGAGSQVWAGSQAPAAGQVKVALPELLPSGIYWVRLYSPSQKPLLLREYGFHIS